jgi:hypothetical protein
MKMKILSKAIVVAAVIGVGAALVPPGALARGGGGGGGGFARGGIHVGPVFGFPGPRVATRRAVRHGFVRRFPARFGSNLNRWNVNRFALRNHGANYGAAWAATYPYTGDANAYYDPSDVTGTVATPAPATMLAPPAGAPERPGCYSQNYNVPSADGGTARVVVTRC